MFETGEPDLFIHMTPIENFIISVR